LIFKIFDLENMGNYKLTLNKPTFPFFMGLLASKIPKKYLILVI